MKPSILLSMVCVMAILGTAFFLGRPHPRADQVNEADIDEHTYVTWNTMEFDKSVAAWLIVRFIDKEAKFVFHPVGSEVHKGTPFDVPQSPWKRQHKKCASDCVLESLETKDPAVEKIVEIAHQIEVDYWRYQQFPEAKKCQEDFLEIRKQYQDPAECLQKMLVYLDKLYVKLKADLESAPDSAGES